MVDRSFRHLWDVPRSGAHLLLWDLFIGFNLLMVRGGHYGGAGGALATPGVSMFQEQVIPCHQSGDTL